MAALGDVPVCVNFVGDNHIGVEAAVASGEDEEGMERGSPSEEMYMHFANQRTPGAGRRRERLGRRRWGRMETEHFVRIAAAEPPRRGRCADRGAAAAGPVEGASFAHKACTFVVA